MPVDTDFDTQLWVSVALGLQVPALTDCRRVCVWVPVRVPVWDLAGDPEGVSLRDGDPGLCVAVQDAVRLGRWVGVSLGVGVTETVGEVRVKL